jgi:TIR domain
MITDRIDVFLSRKSQDAHLAKEVYDFLTSKGLQVFDSDHSLLEMGNSDYRRAIDDALVKTEHLIVIGSSVENITSSWVETEWGMFLSRKRSGKAKGNILTVVTKDVEIDDLPLGLQYFEIIPFEKRNEKILPYVLFGRVLNEITNANAKLEEIKIKPKINAIKFKPKVAESIQPLEVIDLIPEVEVTEKLITESKIVEEEKVENSENIDKSKIDKKNNYPTIERRDINVAILFFVGLVLAFALSMYGQYTYNDAEPVVDSTLIESYIDTTSSLPSAITENQKTDYSLLSETELWQKSEEGIAEAQLLLADKYHKEKWYWGAKDLYIKSAKQGNKKAKKRLKDRYNITNY